MKVGVITQARMSSTRLPGKVLLKVKGKTLIEHHLTRAFVTGVPIIVATSAHQSDDMINDLCNSLSVPVFRGSLLNVLDRYYDCAQQFHLDVIIRVTSDCPLIDGDLIRQGLDQFEKELPDYLSNTVLRTFPRGFDFEIFTMKALKISYENAATEFEREHVTPYIWQNLGNKFTIQTFTRMPDASRYRITVDTPDDLSLINKLIDSYHADTKSVDEIIKLLESHPELVQINSHIKQKV